MTQLGDFKDLIRVDHLFNYVKNKLVSLLVRRKCVQSGQLYDRANLDRLQWGIKWDKENQKIPISDPFP